MNGLIPPIWPSDCYVRPVGLVDGGQRAVTHRAMLRPPGGGSTCRGYVKHFVPSARRGLVNEIVGWSLNRLVGVPQGSAAVMKAPTFGGLSVQVAFVSMEASPRIDGTAHERYNISDPEQLQALRRRIRQCKQLPVLIAADQLAINADRNPGNFGFNGKHTFVVFDQSDILGGCDWSSDSLLRPTSWVDHKIVGESAGSFTLMPFSDLDASFRADLMGAITQVLNRFYKGQAKLREALMVDSNPETLLAMNALFWRTLWLESGFREKLGLVI